MHRQQASVIDITVNLQLLQFCIAGQCDKDLCHCLNKLEASLKQLYVNH